MTESSAPTSVRTDGDSWTITESVGLTALGVAASRAAETAQQNPLVRDDFAYLLVSSAGPVWARMAGADPDWIDAADDDNGRRLHEMFRNYQAVRTHYFDAYFAVAMRAGIRQVVILAAGLDARAYRLNWPAGTTVYEIDQPKVLEYKGTTLNGHGAVPAATRRAVAVDLRDDWPAALVAAGFDRDEPTAWLAEGLLPYLPADAQDRLFDRLTALSAPGSRIAVEAFHSDRVDGAEVAERRAKFRERTKRMRAQLGVDMDFESLTYQEPDRAEARHLLAAHGWKVNGVSSSDEMARLGRPVAEDLAEDNVASEFLSATLT